LEPFFLCVYVMRGALLGIGVNTWKGHTLRAVTILRQTGSTPIGSENRKGLDILDPLRTSPFARLSQ
jgi:hypothetical protein